MAVISFKHFQKELLHAEVPVKKGKNYVSSLVYNGEGPLVMQTPKGLTVDMINNKLLFKLKGKGDFYSILEDLKHHVVHELADNSEQFFKGKKFSEKKFNDSVSFFKLVSQDTGECHVEVNVNIPKDQLKVFDQFKDPLDRELQLSDKDNRCIIKFENLVFSATSISLEVTLTHVKLYYPQKNDIKGKFFLDESEDENESQCQEEETRLEPEKNDDNRSFFEE